MTKDNHWQFIPIGKNDTYHINRKNKGGGNDYKTANSVWNRYIIQLLTKC